jgi:hypothetical protein
VATPSKESIQHRNIIKVAARIPLAGNQFISIAAKRNNMHLAFKYIKSYKDAIKLYNSLKNAGKETFMTYLPDQGKYFVRFYH